MSALFQPALFSLLSPAAESALEELTIDQGKAFKSLYDAIQAGESTTRLLGYAGTGKSHTLTRLVRSLHRPIVLTAPTNKAATVLRGMASEMGNDQIEVTTIHKALGLKPDVDYRTGKMSLKRIRGADIPDDALVVVDEASMVSRELLDLITNEVSSIRGAQVLFVGDPAQLPPVGESRSHALISQNGDVTETLTEIVRQKADHPVLKLTAELRNAIDGADVPRILEKIHPDGSIRILDSLAFEKELLSEFRSEAYQDDPDHCRILTYTNERSREFNGLVRRELLGSMADECQLLPNETVVCCKPIVQDRQVLAQIGDNVRVIDVDDSEDPEYGIPSLQVRLITPDCGEVTVFVVRNPEGLGDYRTVLTLLSKAAKDRQAELNDHRRRGIPYPVKNDQARRSAWRDLFKFKEELFADLRPAHASTVHRSQGSTYGTVFIDLEDIGRNTKRSEILRLLYVGLSRPRGDVVLTGKLPERLYSLNEKTA